MYMAGIPVGLLVDNKGPRPGALLGCVSLGTGYFSMYRGKNSSPISDPISTSYPLAAYEGGPGSIEMPWLCLFAFMTGIGGCAAFAGAIKTCKTH